MDDVAHVLRDSEIFQGLGGAVLELLEPVAAWRRVGAGTMLFRQGTPREAIYLLVEGQLEIVREHDSGTESLIVLGPGSALGEGALLHSAEHSTSARAITDLRLLELDAKAVRGQLAQHAEAAIELLTRVALTVSRRLQYASPREVGRAQAYRSATTRREHDLLGEREVPADALYGVQTLRAVENFPITGIRMSHFPTLVRALAMVKQAAARANRDLELLAAPVAGAIDRACQEIIDGHWHGHFVVDMVQGGAGTSTNMNANEVIANRALELLGHEPRGLPALPPQQPRQPLPVDQRRLPDRHPGRRRSVAADAD